MNRTTILHICSDYPHPGSERSTKAVHNLIQATPEFEHIVVSMERTSVSNRIQKIRDNLVVYRYFGLPRGFAFECLAYLHAFVISRKLLRQKVTFDVIHGHKLSTDGMVAYYLSEILAKPYLITIRGYTDSRHANYFYTYKPLLKKIAQSAGCVLTVSPWSTATISSSLNLQPGLSVEPFPNIVDLTSYLAEVADNGRYFSVFNTGDFKNKGFVELVQAVHMVKILGVDIKVDVFGRIDDRSYSFLVRRIQSMGLESSFRFKGLVSNNELLQSAHEYRAMVLPSKVETFGMVYTESLLSGCPIIYSRDTGVSGFLDEDLSYAIAVNPKDPSTIAKALLTIDSTHLSSKRKLASDLKGGKLDHLKKADIIATYRRCIAGVLNRNLLA
ncbi:glycosyltransferase [Gilvimarinus sp. F26214L]|uniref:glycosyltransferase n=1 Tax=Gilvimarinus sp. DZF01 TaxID=3461371 RepID=UPI004045F624